MYIPLHMHYAKGSIGDSILTPEKAVKKAVDLNIPALSITDHGSMSCCVEFYKKCTENNIKPIIGMEVYETIDRTKKAYTKKEKKLSAEKGIILEDDLYASKYYHLILLAKNKQGYQDLLRIAEDAQFNGYYYKPRTDMSVLKEYGSNLIGLSACLGGRIPQLVKTVVGLSNNGIPDEEEERLLLIRQVFNISTEEAEDINSGYSSLDLTQLLMNTVYKDILTLIDEYKECFSDFYLELQPGDFQEQIDINTLLIELAKETNTKLVITNDVHYLDAEDWIIHDKHVKMNRKEKDNAPQVYPDKCYYLMGYEEIRTMFPYISQDIIEQALANTVEIANSINLDNLYDGKIKMPRADIPLGYTEDGYLAKLATDKLYEISERLPDPCAYYDRVKYELDTLKEVGFSGYLLIIKDIMDYAGNNNIPMGPGRGSIAGSLVAYLIGITKVDSIKYGLIFERFISVHRKGSVPDIDLDCSAEKRHLLFEYTINKYGKDCCALVSTFMIRKARSAIKDTARLFDITPDYADEVSKMIPQTYYSDEDGEKKTDVSIEEALSINADLRAVKEKHENWFEAAMKLEDIPKTTSIHAAGTLISPTPLRTYVPLIRGKDGGMMATSLNLEDAEFSGAIKYDYLSLLTLDVIDATMKDVNVTIDYDDDNFLNDPYVWDLIGSKNTTGLFQIASNTYKQRMWRLKPRSIEELAACLALVRGPCISSKLDEQYMQIVEGKKEIELIHPFYDSVTANTNGILLYQEQIMEVLVNFGMTTERGFQIMKLAAKKKVDKLAQAEEEFKELARINNVPEDVANKVWHMILDSGKYSFNKSHAVSYALLCYNSGFFKAYYPAIYLANALTNACEKRKDDNVSELVQDCRRVGIKFLEPDINKSKWKFAPEDGAMRIGFCAIKGLGEKAFEELVAHRPYTSMIDMYERINKSAFNKKAWVTSAFAGAFSEFEKDRLTVYRTFCELREEMPLEEIKISKDIVFNSDDDYQKIETILYEIPLVSDPVQLFEEFNFYNLREREQSTFQAIVRRVKKTKDKNGNPMAFLTVETTSGYLDAVVFKDAYKGNTKYMKNNTVVCLEAVRQKNGLVINKFVA